MEIKKVSYIRNVRCSICGSKLLSIYARNSKTFISVANWYFCEKCNKVFLLSENTKKNRNKIELKKGNTYLNTIK